MENKLCQCCKKYKNISLFNKDKQKKDGLYSYCKECHRKKVNIYTKGNIARMKHRIASAKWEKNNRLKKNAQNAARRANIPKMNCIVCGSENSQKHHTDYSNKLEVVWLCPEHHKLAHKEKTTWLEFHEMFADCHHSQYGEDGCDCDLIRMKEKYDQARDDEIDRQIDDMIMEKHEKGEGS